MVMSSDARDKWRELTSWRELMQPWLSALRSAELLLELPPLHTAADREDLWFSIEVSRFQDHFDQTVEAMEMLDLVARIDRDCAWRLLLESAGCHAAQLLPLYGEALWNTSAGPAFPQYELKIDGGWYHGSAACGQLGRLRSNKPMESPHGRSIKRMLLARLDHTNSGGRALDRSLDGYVKLRIKLDIVGIDANAIVPLLSAVSTLASGLRNPSTRKVYGVYPLQREDRGVFQCDSCRVKFHDGPQSSDVMAALYKIQYQGVRLTHVVVPPMHSGSVDCFLAATTSLHVGKLDDDGVRKFFTAIANSKSLPELSFDPEFWNPDNNTHAGIAVNRHRGRPELYWMWLAYALFSGKTRHNATAVTINIRGLLDAHVTLMRDVLLQSDPLKLLKQAEAAAIEPSPEPSLWWPRRPIRTLPTHTIRHLTISASWTIEMSLFQLLELVGGQLTRLSLTEIGNSPRHLILDAVFIHCHNLRRLDLDMLLLETLDWFKYRYRPSHNLHTLCLGGDTPVAVDELASWTDLFTTLSDPTHALFKTLRHLYVNLWQVTMDLARPDQIATLDALVRMLEVNDRLERVEVGQCSHEMKTAFRDRIQTHPQLAVAPGFAQRVCGFYPRRHFESHDFA